MDRTFFSVTIEIAADPEQVWQVMADVERWPEWTASISRVVLMTPAPLQTGSRARIHQPRLPPAIWLVTELKPGHEFTWISAAPGLKVTARHLVEPVGNGSRVTLSIRYEGFFGPLLARLTRRLNETYIEMEAQGLKARCAPVGERRIGD